MYSVGPLSSILGLLFSSIFGLALMSRFSLSFLHFSRYMQQYDSLQRDGRDLHNYFFFHFEIADVCAFNIDWPLWVMSYGHFSTPAEVSAWECYIIRRPDHPLIIKQRICGRKLGKEKFLVTAILTSCFPIFAAIVS